MNSRTVTCEYCSKQFPKAIKRITQTEKLGQKHTCSRKCSSDLVNEERRCEPSTTNAEDTRRDKDLNPKKNEARSLVRHAVRSGQIVPPQECEVCLDAEGLEGHHPDHLRPFLLLYLCRSCHRMADSSEDKWIDLASDYSDRVC